jgi:acetyl esterase
MNRAPCDHRRGAAGGADGEADHLVPVDGTYRFVEQARAAGVDVDLVTVPYADHVYDGRRGSIGAQAYRQLTARWLRDHGLSP